MGGDHKCPVCQATFTRPQHVARHMRSHTGDRPYKCQYCGDQFARSDLLSRHVNKCHANEKPVTGGNTTGRRKGSTSLSRATTSKQACDQCVQSSLPCDGSNPCSKCVQRKYRCTYVKFHRQTAPVGPGHNPNPTLPHARQEHSSASSVLGLNNPSLNITLGSSTSSNVGGSSGVRFPLYGSSASPVDDFYHLPPPTGYTAGSTADPTALYGSAYTTARISAIDTEDMYGSMNRPGTASSAGSSSASGHGHGSWHPQQQQPSSATSSVFGHSLERLEPRSLHGQGIHHHGQSSHLLDQPQSHHLSSTSSAHPSSHGMSPTHNWSSSRMGDTGVTGGGGYAPPHDPEDLDINGHAHQFRELFAEDFGRVSPVMGMGHQAEASDGGSSDGGHSVGSAAGQAQRVGASASGHGGKYGSQRGRRRYMNEGLSSDPYAYEYAPRRARAGSTASRSSTRPSTQHGLDSVAPTPLITGQTLGPQQSQPASATNTTFSNAFGSLSLGDANALASLVATGRSSNDPDATPMGLTPFRAASSTAAAGTIQRPLSSLAALPPSSYLNSAWAAPGQDQQAQQEGVMAGNGPYGWGGNPMMSGSGTAWTFLNDFSFGMDSGGSAPGGCDGATSQNAESSNDDASSSSGMGLAMPPPLAGGIAPTPGREMDAKEMKEFWKMYMRTPLTGPGFDASVGQQVGGGGGPSGTSGDNNNLTFSTAADSNLNATQSHSLMTPTVGGFRRQRVASFPSSNSTPRLQRDGAVAHLQHLQSQVHFQQQKMGFGGFGPMSSLRTTLHGALGGGGSEHRGVAGLPGHTDDLSSYGAAVLARRAPVNLNFARALGRMRQQQQHQNQHPTGHAHAQAGSSGSSGSPSVSSRSSSVGVSDGHAPDNDTEIPNQQHVVRPRPSVKRLASTVLESEIAKVGRFEDSEGHGADETPRGSIGDARVGETPSLPAPKPSAPFNMPQAQALDQHETVNGGNPNPMFPPPGTLGHGVVNGEIVSSSMPPPPPVSTSAPPRGMGISQSPMAATLSQPGIRSSGGMTLLERRTGRQVGLASNELVGQRSAPFLHDLTP